MIVCAHLGYVKIGANFTLTKYLAAKLGGLIWLFKSSFRSLRCAAGFPAE